MSEKCPTCGIAFAAVPGRSVINREVCSTCCAKALEAENKRLVASHSKELKDAREFARQKSEEVERLQTTARRHCQNMLAAANVCDAWAKQSEEESWSTHQVKANLLLADSLRRDAANLQAALKGKNGE